MKNLKKVMCGIMAGLMLTASVPVGIPQIACVTEVQAASLETPRLVSVKAMGKKRINLILDLICQTGIVLFPGRIG